MEYLYTTFGTMCAGHYPTTIFWYLFRSPGFNKDVISVSRGPTCQSRQKILCQMGPCKLKNE